MEQRGALFEAASDEDEGPSHQAAGGVPFAADEVYPVNNPPTKRPRLNESKRKAKGKVDKKAAPAKPTIDTSSITASNPAQIEAPSGERGDDLLDNRNVPDTDELYGENERALSNFIKLHPMLSLDSTSERLLNKVSSMIDETTIDTKELETVTKSHDDLFLREAKVEIGERPCALDDKCVCRWIAIFRHGEASEKAFVCREFLLPSQQATFVATGELPRTTGKCLICSRYYTNHIYTIAKNSPSFCSSSPIAIQAFQNKIEAPSATSVAPACASAVGVEDGYKASVMLYADEKWADSSSSRSPLSALLWKPSVRFKSSDYEFKTDTDGTRRVIQVNMCVENQNFSQPPASLTPK